MSYIYKYPRPAVTADIVVITREFEPKVMLIQRGGEPYKGCWAFYNTIRHQLKLKGEASAGVFLSAELQRSPVQKNKNL